MGINRHRSFERFGLHSATLEHICIEGLGTGAELAHQLDSFGTDA